MHRLLYSVDESKGALRSSPLGMRAEALAFRVGTLDNRMSSQVTSFT
jgi:hypothetical protein